MKSKGSMVSATPLVAHEELDYFELVLDDLPKGDISISVLYEDVKDPANYEVGEVPDGHLVYTFPIVGKGGVARIFVDETLVGKKALG